MSARSRAVIGAVGAMAVACGAAVADTDRNADAGGPGNDASSTDESAATDGGGDAPSETSMPKTFCQTEQHDFCEDFDGVLRLGAADSFTRTQIYASGDLVVADGGLVGSIIPRDAGGYNPANIILERKWPKKTATSRSTITHRWQATIEVCPTASAPVSFLGFLAGVDRDDFYRWSFQIQQAKFGIDCEVQMLASVSANADAGIAQGIYASAGNIPVAVGTARDYELTIDEADDQVTLKLTVSGMTKTMQFAARTESEWFTFGVGIGNYVTNQEAARVRTDDVRTDYMK